MTTRAGRAVEVAVVCAAVGCLLIGLVTAMGAANPLGYDESVYAVLARHWVTGTPASGWDLHRPPLLSVIGIVPAAFGGTLEWPFRLVGVGSSIALFAVAWWLARRIGGAIAGVVMAVVVAGASSLQVEGASFLTDVPSAAVLMATTAVLWRQLATGAISAAFAWLAPLAAAAFYLRYGSILAVGGLTLAAACVAPRPLWAGRRTILVTGALFVLLLLPHFVIATLNTGAPWGILARAEVAAGASKTLPLINYARWFASSLLGPAAALAAVGGVVAAVCAVAMFLLRRAASGRGRFAAFSALAACLQLAILGTQLHAEARYAFFPVLLLAVAGAVAVAALARRIRWSTTGATATILVASVVAGASVIGALQATSGEAARRTAASGWLRDAGKLVRATSEGSCYVLTADAPIISWYSTCPAIGFAVAGGSDRTALLTGNMRFVVLRADGHLQPSPAVVEEVYLPKLDLIRRFQNGADQEAGALYRVR